MSIGWISVLDFSHMSQPPTGIQEWIYSLEEGGGRIWLTRFLVVLIAVFLGTVYHLTEFRNLNAPEAMDTAQIARNLSEKKGFTTQFIRPASLHLIQKRVMNRGQDGRGILRQPHPDLANPPVYPLLLAGWMKVAPFKFTIMEQTSDGGFERHQPDVLIGYFNLGIFCLLLLQIFLLARHLFDPWIAGLSVVIVYGSEILWRFVYSGLSTVFLMSLFLFVIQVLAALDSGERSQTPRSLSKSLLLALVLGGLLGIGCMTRYAFGWLVIPVSLFVLVSVGARRWLLTPAVGLAFVIVITPWLWRNYSLCGQPFGVATYAVVEETAQFTGTRLLRSQSPDMSRVTLDDVRRKVVLNVAEIAQDELSRLGGSWVSGFFLVGLLVPFNNRSLQRLRWFLVMAIGTLIIAQALGRTWLSTFSPVINSENLLAILFPMVVVYGVSLFYLLLERLEFPMIELKAVMVGAFALVAALPLILKLLPPRMPAMVYPPYRPDFIQAFTSFLNPDELMMTDMPWATAWYGQRDSVWTSNRVVDEKGDDFFNINDNQRTIKAIYISPISADSPMRSSFIRDPDFAWGRFYMDALLLQQMPNGFPLKYMMPGGLLEAGHFFLTDWPRWTRKGGG